MIDSLQEKQRIAHTPLVIIARLPPAVKASLDSVQLSQAARPDCIANHAERGPVAVALPDHQRDSSSGRELDELLLRYLDVHYAQADEEEKAAFEAVLSLADPELNAYLLQRQVPSSESIAGAIDRILRRTQT